LTKSTTLASELLTATGVCCLRIVTLAGHPGHSRISLGGIADRDAKGHRIWFSSTRSAERIIAETYRTHGQRRGDGLVIEAAADEAYRLVQHSARLILVAVMDDAEIDAKLDSLAKRAEAAIGKMPRRQRAMKHLRGVSSDNDLPGLMARL
jgi:hypothetical protein